MCRDHEHAVKMKLSFVPTTERSTWHGLYERFFLHKKYTTCACDVLIEKSVSFSPVAPVSIMYKLLTHTHTHTYAITPHTRILHVVHNIIFLRFPLFVRPPYPSPTVPTRLQTYVYKHECVLHESARVHYICVFVSALSLSLSFLCHSHFVYFCAENIARVSNPRCPATALHVTHARAHTHTHTPPFLRTTY